MFRRRSVTRRIAAFLYVLLFPVAAWAQQASGIGGQVTDASGAVVPGVTVEATSPVLIEKVRSVVTDGDGRYRLIDLRPGTYVVTFSLEGFSTFEAGRHRADGGVHGGGGRGDASRRVSRRRLPWRSRVRWSTCRTCGNRLRCLMRHSTRCQAVRRT